MKKQLLAFLLSFAFVGLTYALEELDLSSDTFCENSPKAQVRAGLFYLPNQEDPYSGENLCIYTNGQYYNRGEIINGLKAGNWSWWHNNGQLDKTHVYRDGNLVSETAFKYFANGQQQIEQTFNFKYENDIKILLNAKLTLWKKDGKLERIQEFGSENVMNEVRFNYFDNDQLESKISFKDGKLEGSSFYWFENGNKKKELTLENEKRHGRYTEWYESGQIMHDGNYVQGELVGKASWWFESGQKSQEGSYNRDDSGFKLINWYENGQMKSMVTIVRGKPSGQYTKWSEEGQKKVEGSYQGHKKHPIKCSYA